MRRDKFFGAFQTFCCVQKVAGTELASGIGYAPKGMIKGYVAIPIRLPTGELTGYIGTTERKLPKEFLLSKVVTLPKKSAQEKAPRNCGAFS